MPATASGPSSVPAGSRRALPSCAPIGATASVISQPSPSPSSGVDGALLARRAQVPAGALLGPMIVAGAVTLSGTDFHVPPALRELAFALIGVQVGLRFTLSTLRLLGRLFVPVLIALAGLLVGCAGLAVLLHLTAGVSFQDAYLATTPGGLYAVLAVAFGAGANTTFILAVQALRLLVAVLLAPLAVRRLARVGRQSG
jgi:membrane AbrB-like protein